MTGAPGTGLLATWRLVNISPVERAGRIGIGVLGLLGGILLLSRADSVLTGALEVALILAGLDMIVTGATGHCPLYQRLGRTLRPSRSTR